MPDESGAGTPVPTEPCAAATVATTSNGTRISTSTDWPATVPETVIVKSPESPKDAPGAMVNSTAAISLLLAAIDAGIIVAEAALTMLGAVLVTLIES